MDYKPASKETIEKLYENMGSNFSLFVPLLNDYIGTLENLEQLDENESQYANYLILCKVLLKLNIISLIINLDLSTFLRANFRSTSTFEKRCNLKYVNVTIIEGYSYLFGFDDKKNSLWRIIKNLTERISDDEFIKDINTIEQHAKNFKNTYAQRIDRDNRNLSIHYDSEPIKVYNYLTELSEDTETIRASNFLKLFEDISVFTNKYVQKYPIPLINSTSNYNIDFWEKVNYFPDENQIIFCELDGRLASFAERLDRIVAQCKLPQKVQEKLGPEYSISGEIQPLIETIYPGIHILFMYLDLSCAIRAYLSSEIYFEKQLNLRRINIVLYEGFKHIYGYSESDHTRSFWSRSISPILTKSTDKTLLDSLAEIECELKEIATDGEINNAQLRECSVHYRYKDRDNTVALFHTLIKSSPFFELNKSLKLLKLLQKLLTLNENSVNLKYILEQRDIKLSNNKTLATIDNILSMIEQQEMDSDKKQKLISVISGIKNLLSI